MLMGAREGGSPHHCGEAQAWCLIDRDLPHSII